MLLIVKVPRPPRFAGSEALPCTPAHLVKNTEVPNLAKDDHTGHL